MFTWICPKCGSEVSPSYSECPKCSAAPAAAAPEAAAPSPPPTVAAVRPAMVPPTAQQPAARQSVSPVLVAAGAALAMVALLAVLYLFVLPRWTGAGATAGATEAPLQNAGPAGSSAPAHPMAKHLEVAGLRVTPAKPGTARVQFLVINHSAADLPEMALDLTLRGASGGAAIFEFQVKLPSIGPYESRELTSMVNTALKPYELPDWQAVRADFRLRSE